MTNLPYNPPVKKYDYRGILAIVDKEGKTVLEILPQSRDISYEKRMVILVALVIDLLNGKRKIEYNPDNDSYEVWDLIAPPSPPPPVQTVVDPPPQQSPDAEPKKKRGRPPKAK